MMGVLSRVARRLRPSRRSSPASATSALVATAKEARLISILDAAVDAFIGIDSVGCITEWNAAAVRIFGWQSTHVIGQDIVQVLAPARLHTRYHEDLGHVLGNSARYLPRHPVQLVGRCRNGSEIPLEVAVSAVSGTAGVELHAFVRDISSRHDSERQMRTLAQLVASSGDAIYSRRLNGAVMSWNAAAERLFGYSPKDVVNGAAEGFVPVDRREELWNLLRGAADGIPVQQIETVRRTATGDSIEVALTVSPIYDVSGTIIGASTNARDISERRRVERELQRSEESFREAFDEAMLGMSFIGPDGRFRRVNPVFAEMVDRGEDELCGMSFDSVVHPDDRERAAESVRRILAGEVSEFTEELRYLRPDGTTGWAALSCSLVRDASGQVRHLVAQTVDVTGRMDAERQRDAHAAMLRSVIEHHSALIAVKDLAGRYLLANKRFEEELGVREEDLLGGTDDVLDGDLAPAWRANDLRAQRGVLQVKEWIATTDDAHCLDVVKFPLYDADGLLYATCGISTDLSATRYAAVATRARDEAQQASAAKSAFLSTMSHEIRTPMNAVLGMTELLAKTSLDARQRDMVDTVRTSGETLLAVINDILDFSKIESGNLELEAKPFDVVACIGSSLAMVAGSAATKGIDLVWHRHSSCPRWLVGDVTRLRQVLVNLLSNAVKFTEEGEAFVTVAADDLGAEGIRLRVSVADSGIGIAAERMDRLFRPFSQVDASTTRVYGGTGLGLTISRRLVTAMGGELEVVSNPGIGSVFTFTACLGRSAEGGGSVAPAPSLLAGRSVLLVDHNDIHRRMVRLLLEAEGMTCADTASPGTALGWLAGGAAYDVALLDVGMPEMDGDQLASELRRLPTGRELPIVLLSSIPYDPERRTEFTASLQKPVRTAALVAVLAGVLGVSVPEIPPQGRIPRQPAPSSAPHGVPLPLRILLAEDDPINRKLGSMMLDDLGFAIDIAKNGREAAEAVRCHPYDVVFMDVHMPEMDGLEATRRIREDPSVARQPRIVAMTASVLAEDRTACADAGMDDYIAKPVREVDLLAALASVGCRPGLVN